MAEDPTEDDEIEDWATLQVALATHADIIGRVTISWNMCQLMVFSLFYSLSGMSWENARALFFTLKADVQQRDVTMALAMQLPKTKSPRKKIMAAIARLNELAGERNAAIHTMWQIAPDRGGLVPADDITHNAKLKLDDPAGQFRRLDRELALVHAALIKAMLAQAVYAASQNTDDKQTSDPSANA